MRTVTRTPALALLAGLAFASHTTAAADATPECPSTDTVTDCLTLRINRALGEKAAAAEASALNAKVKPGDGLARASSSLDYLSQFFVAAGLGTTKRDDGNLVFQFKPELLGSTPKRPVLLRITVFEPKPFEALIAKAPEDKRAAFKERLSDEFSETDDLGLTLTVGLRDESALFARYAAIVGDVAGQVASPGMSATLEPFEELTRALNDFGREPTMEELAGARSTHRQEVESIEAAMAATVEAALAFAKERSVLFRDAGLYRLADLIEAQPRFFLEASLRSRVDAAGPDGYRATVTYERGFENLATVARHCSRSRGRQVTVDSLDGACLEGYVSDQPAPAGKGRIAFSADYEVAEPLEFSAPELGAPFRVERGKKLVVAATGSRYLNRSDPTADGSRFDVEAKYEDVSDDPTRTDRFVATATLTHRLADMTSLGDGLVLTTSLVYANHHEYLPTTDRELSAHLGLKLKVDKK